MNKTGYPVLFFDFFWKNLF